MISYNNVNVIDYIYRNFELTDYYVIERNYKISDKFLVYIANKETGEEIKTQFTGKTEDINLLTVLYYTAVDIDSYDEIDGSYDTREEEQRLKKMIRREKRALNRLLDDTNKEVEDFVREMKELYL
jgi:hypothetical protein